MDRRHMWAFCDNFCRSGATGASEGNASMNTINENTIWWQVYPLGFTGAPIRPKTHGERELTPRLDALTPWLDYLVALGANGLLLGPVFASQTHGYDTVDYFHIDARLGGDASFDRLMQACDDRGVRVLLDGVFNHVGVGSPLFQDALAGRGHEDMFTITTSPEGIKDYATFEGHASLPELNHNATSTARLVTDVMLHWLRRGIAGWRLDAAYAVQPSFWSLVLPSVRAEFPDAWFMGEVIHGDYAAIVRDSSLDSLTQYELWKAIWSSLKEGNFFELDWSLKRHNEFLNAFTPQTFVGNHDVTRIASRVGDQKAALAMTILFTVGGIPSVYYGDEQAFRGIKEDHLGGDDAVRPAFPATPADLSPRGAWMYRLHQDLIDLRRRNPWLVTAHTAPIALDNRAYAYDVLGERGECLHVSLALDPAPHADITQNGARLLHVER